MAILQGFPPSNTISPSVRITEKDLSFIAPDQSLHRAGLIGFASKGPVNLPTLIATTRQLTTTFGYPHPDVSDPFLIYAAQQYLLVANELYVVRVADVDPVSDEVATIASATVPAAGTLVEIESDYIVPSTNVYTFENDSFFRWRLNGVLSAHTLVVMSGSYSVTDLISELNSQIDFENDGIEFYETISSTIGVKTTFAYGPAASLELVSIHNAMYGGSVTDPVFPNPTGLGLSMTPAVVIGTEAHTASDADGTFNLTSLTNVIQIVIDGTDNLLIDGVVQQIELDITNTTIADIVDDINAQAAILPGGFYAYVDASYYLKIRTAHTGTDARLRIKPESTAAVIFGLSTLTKVGTSGSTTTGSGDTNLYGLVYGAANLTDDVAFTVTADSPGIDGNSTQIVIANDTRIGSFTIQVFNNGAPVESWGNLTKDQASSYYVETYISLVSDFIRVSDNTDIGAGPLNGTYSLSGGSDGIPSDPDRQDQLLIGNPVGYTGIYTLSEPEQINIDLIAVPGHSSTSVVQALLELCQVYRQDCLAIIDPPFGLTVNEIIAWQNGSHPLNLYRFDSDFGALYWPWVKIRDTYNRVDVWIPPSGSIMAVIARSDFLSAPWFAPAGQTRGIVPNIGDVYSRPTLAERDLMYGNRNCINPIVQFSDVAGFLVWGQKTLQRTPTALDRVNVRRLMFYLEKNIRIASRQLLFDPNDEAFQRTFKDIATEILNSVKVGRGLNDFIILADATLNTPDVVDRNEFRAQIGVQPTRAAEFMFIEFSIHRTGSFSESATTL